MKRERESVCVCVLGGLPERKRVHQEYWATQGQARVSHEQKHRQQKNETFASFHKLCAKTLYHSFVNNTLTLSLSPWTLTSETFQAKLILVVVV